mmetsp:Transcript_35066/g.139245  ORF Transcript_35066/g.139245 Transcript_35066/m.139245 type:complete len:220 (-) Transcript_35066:869-1528(-)
MDVPESPVRMYLNLSLRNLRTDRVQTSLKVRSLGFRAWPSKIEARKSGPYALPSGLTNVRNQRYIIHRVVTDSEGVSHSQVPNFRPVRSSVVFVDERTSWAGQTCSRDAVDFSSFVPELLSADLALIKRGNTGRVTNTYENLSIRAHRETAHVVAPIFHTDDILHGYISIRAARGWWSFSTHYNHWVNGLSEVITKLIPSNDSTFGSGIACLFLPIIRV